MDTWWRSLSDLDEHQKKVIGLPADGSHLVKGPPGSGKTNLLLLRANYLSQVEHFNLAVIVFNRTLREYIRAGSHNYSFSADRVQTVRQLFDGLLSEARADYDTTDDFDEDRRSRLAAVSEVFGEGRKPIYDLILLDESQDYLEEEIRLFRRLSHDLFLVADSRQQIYAGGSKIQDLESVVGGNVLELPNHYRNGQPICDVADAIGGTFSMGYEPIGPTCNYNSPGLHPSVEVFQGGLDEQIDNIADKLKIQLRTYPDELLGVICPRNSELSTIAKGLESRGFGSTMCVQKREDGYQPIQSDRPIWVSSIHSAKGLEFRALHFAAAEFVSNFRSEQKRLAYTGVTRAKTSLTILHDNTLPNYFDAAVNPYRKEGVSTKDIGAAFGPE